MAQQNIARPPLMVAQMTEEWLNYYRKIAQSNTVPGAVKYILVAWRILRRNYIDALNLANQPQFFYEDRSC